MIPTKHPHFNTNVIFSTAALAILLLHLLAQPILGFQDSPASDRIVRAFYSTRIPSLPGHVLFSDPPTSAACIYYCSSILELCTEDTIDGDLFPSMEDCEAACSDFRIGGSEPEYATTDTLSCRMLQLLDLQTGTVDPEIGCAAAGPDSSVCQDPSPPPTWGWDTPAPTIYPETPAPTQVVPVPCTEDQCIFSRWCGGTSELPVADKACNFDSILHRIPGAMNECCQAVRKISQDSCATSVFMWHFTHPYNATQRGMDAITTDDFMVVINKTATLVSFAEGICRYDAAPPCIPTPDNGVMDGPEACADCVPWYYDWTQDEVYGELYKDARVCDPEPSCEDGCINGDEEWIDIGGTYCFDPRIPPTPAPTEPPEPTTPVVPSPSPTPVTEPPPISAGLVTAPYVESGGSVLDDATAAAIGFVALVVMLVMLCVVWRFVSLSRHNLDSTEKDIESPSVTPANSTRRLQTPEDSPLASLVSQPAGPIAQSAPSALVPPVATDLQTSPSTSQPQVGSGEQLEGGGGVIAVTAAPVDPGQQTTGEGAGSPDVDLPQHWTRNIADDGRVYYWNSMTMESRWDRPT